MPNEKKLEKKLNDLSAAKLVDALLERAVFENASAIHLEPRGHELIVRYRLDDQLREVMTLPKNSSAGVGPKIKILAKLNPKKQHLPQEGSFEMKIGKHEIFFRVSVLPLLHGEKIVLRLFNESAPALNLEELGLQPSEVEIIKKNISKPNGLILATGPAGTGKTTTLYSILNILNQSGVKIVAIEEQIKYHLPGVHQSVVNHKIGYTFASGLRALLRQNPQIILVGEIKDQKTADLAFGAAITGHRIFSTLPAKNTAAALGYLSALKIEPFLIASATNLIIAGRLVRKICQNCRVAYKPSKKMLAELEKNFNPGELKKNPPRFYKGKGCQKCDQTGYAGQIGVFEILEIDAELGEMILKKIPAEKIRQKAKEKGVLTLAEDALLKAKEGITSLEEVLRVAKE